MAKRNTPVMFRVDGTGEVWAVFPATDTGNGDAQAYSERHGWIDVRLDTALKTTRPASREEYTPLRRTVEGLVGKVSPRRKWTIRD